MTSQAGLQWGLLIPVASVGVGALLIMALDAAFGRKGSRSRVGGRRALLLTICGTLALLVSFFSAWVFLTIGETASFDPLRGYFQMDGLAAASIAIVSLFGILVFWLSSTYLMALRIHAAVYFALLLLSMAGAFVAFSANHLLILYVGLELLTLPAHLLAGFDRGRLRSNEAGLKSYLFGAFASAVLLYGLALLYGATGRLDFGGIRIALEMGSPLATAGLVLMLVGIAVKAGLAPLHQWTPDVDEGAPTSVTAFVSVCVRGAALLVLLRVVVYALPPAAGLKPVFAVLALIGIVVGSLMATVQRNVKRLIAWAGVAQAGTMLLAFVAGSAEAYGAMIFYLISLGFMTLGALGVVLTLHAGGRELERMEDLAGLGRARPGIAALLTFFLMGLAGLPPTAGFWAKLQLLGTLVDSGDVLLVLITLLCSVVCLYAYMRIPTMMYMREAPARDMPEASTSELAVLLGCAATTLYLGLLPNPVLPGMTEGLLELLQKLALSPF